MVTGVQTCALPILSTSTTPSSESYQALKGQLNDRTKLSAGFDWTPNPLSLGSYFNRCTYKAGAYYSKSYANADVTGTIKDKPYEFGVSAGITLPVANKNIWYNIPRINLSVQWVHTNIPYLNAATLRQSVLKENYLRFCIGVTFSERWFDKWKVQ